MTASVTTNSYLSPMWTGIKKSAKAYANFVFGVEQNDKFSQTLSDLVRGKKVAGSKKRTGGHGFMQLGDDIKTSWKDSKSVLFDAAGKEKTLWTVIKDSFKSFKPEWKAAKGFGKSFGVLWKRMPLIGNVLMVGMEIPNLYKAYKEGGVATGIGETLKVAAKLGVMTGAMALGAAFGGPLGGIGGAMLGGWVADKIFGKSYSDKKAEEQEKAKNATAENSKQENAQSQTQSVTADEAQNSQMASAQNAPQLDPSVLQYLSPEELAYVQSAYQAQYSAGGNAQTKEAPQQNSQQTGVNDMFGPSLFASNYSTANAQTKPAFNGNPYGAWGEFSTKTNFQQPYGFNYNA